MPKFLINTVLRLFQWRDVRTAPYQTAPSPGRVQGAAGGDCDRPIASQFLSFQPLLPPFKQIHPEGCCDG